MKKQIVSVLAAMCLTAAVATPSFAEMTKTAPSRTDKDRYASVKKSQNNFRLLKEDKEKKFMLKTIKKLLSAILSVSVLTVSAAVFASADAQAAEFNPQDKLIMLSSCSNFTGNYSTSNVPDGAGMKITINSATSNSNNITGSYLENSISLTKEQLSKGAFIIYSGHDESRTLSDGTEETAYADNLFMFRFNNGSNVDLKIDGASGGKPVYFISSATGTVIRNDTNNSSTKLAVDSDGNYYNEGYWVIPGASLQLSTLTDGVSYPFTLLKCNPRNIKDTDNINNYLSATCNYYYDNLSFVENIEDILGTAADGVYEGKSSCIQKSIFTDTANFTEALRQAPQSAPLQVLKQVATPCRPLRSARTVNMLTRRK